MHAVKCLATLILPLNEHRHQIVLCTQRDRQMNNCSEKENMSHNISPTHSQTHTLYNKMEGFLYSSGVSESVYVLVGVRRYVQRCDCWQMPIEAIVPNGQLPCVYTCSWRSDCVCSAKPPTIHFSLYLHFSCYPFHSSSHSLHPTPFSLTGLYKSTLFRGGSYPLLKQQVIMMMPDRKHIIDTHFLPWVQQTFGVRLFNACAVSYASQGGIHSIKITVKPVILWNMF